MCSAGDQTQGLHAYQESILSSLCHMILENKMSNVEGLAYVSWNTI